MDDYEAGTTERLAPNSREVVYIIIHVDLELMLCVNTKALQRRNADLGLITRTDPETAFPKQPPNTGEQDCWVFSCHLTSRESFDEWVSGCLFYPASVTVFPTLTPVDSINTLLRLNELNRPVSEMTIQYCSHKHWPVNLRVRLLIRNHSSFSMYSFMSIRINTN